MVQLYAVLDAEFAIKHPQGSRIFTRASLLCKRKICCPWAAVGAAVCDRLGVRRRRGMQQHGQACLVTICTMHLQVRTLRWTRAQCPCRRSVQSAVCRNERPTGNSTQSWKRSLGLLVRYASWVPDSSLRGSLQGLLVRRVVNTRRRRPLGILLAMVRRQRGRLRGVLQRRQ